MILQVSLADVVEEPLRSLLHEIQDVVEALGSTVVRIGDLPLRRVRRKVQEGTDHGAPPAKASNRPVVLLVHRDDVVEVLTVLWINAAGTLRAYLHTTERGGAQGPLVGWLPDVPCARPG